MAPVGGVALPRLSKMVRRGGAPAAGAARKWCMMEQARVRPEIDAPIMMIDFGAVGEAIVESWGGVGVVDESLRLSVSRNLEF